MRSRATPLLLVLAFTSSGAFAQQGGDDEPLLAALDDPSATIRRDACRELGKRSPFAPEAVDALIERVKTDEAAVVRASAAWALGRAGELGERVSMILVAWPETDRTVDRARRWAVDQLDPRRSLPRLPRPPVPDDLRPQPTWLTTPMQRLVAGASSDDEDRRSWCFQAFCERGAPSLEPLKGLLGHADATVRASAARTIASLHEFDTGLWCGGGPTQHFVHPTPAQYEAVVPGLVPLLGDGQAEVRDAAAEALGELGAQASAAATELGRLLDDPDPGVQFRAAWALGSIGTIDARAGARLVSLLARAEDSELRSNAASACEHVLDDTLVTPALWRAATEDPATEVRFAALRCLMGRGEAPDRCAEALARHVLTTGDAWTRVQACQALARLGHTSGRAIEALVRTVRDDPAGRVQEAASAELHALVRAGLRDERAVAELIRQVDEGFDDAMFVLAEGRVPAALGPISRWLQHEKGSDRACAVRALGALGAPAAPLLVATLAGDLPADELTHVVDAVQRVGPPAAAAAPRLVELAADSRGSDRLRHGALSALCRVGTDDPQVVAALVRLLGSEDRELRLHVIEVLGELGSSAAPSVPTLVLWLPAELESTVMTAAEALGRIAAQPHVAVPALADLLRHPTHDLRECAARALARFGAASRPALDALVVALDDDSSEVRRDAALALAAIGPAAAAAWPGLCRAVDDEDPGVQPAARAALAAIAGDARSAVPRLIADLEDRDARVQESAAMALGQFGPRATPAVPALIRRLEAHDVASAEALGRIGAPELAVPALERALDEAEHDAFIRAARRALRHLR